MRIKMKQKRKHSVRKTRPSASKKAGLPPGALVHVGEIRTPQPVATALSFDAANLSEEVLPTAEAIADHRFKYPRVWLNVYGLQDAALLKSIGQRFGLHPLVLEDILNTGQRPKIDAYGDYLYLVVRMFTWDETAQSLVADQISIVVGKDFVLSFQERPTGVFEPTRQRLRSGGSPMRLRGVDHLAHALLDSAVDRYFAVVDALGGVTEAMEDEALGTPTPDVLQRLNALKHDIITVRRAVWPLREVLGTLVRTESIFFGEDIRPYLRDVLDHTLHVVELLDDVRDLLGDVLEIHLSSVNNRLNQEVRVLTVLTMLFLPASLIAGIFGMNFEPLPLSRGSDGFWLAIALMGVTASILAAIFWRRAWLRSE